MTTKKINLNELRSLVKKIIREEFQNKNISKPSQKIEKFKKLVNEDFGLGALAVMGLALAIPGIYNKAKKMWSKNITGSKYKPQAH